MKRGDFSADKRVFYLGVIAIGIGALASVVALILLNAIAFFTNLFFFGKFSLAAVSPATNHLGAWVILIPALGGLIIGMMARFGSEKIRGHGIPEALEAILFGKSIMHPKVAVLKPLSSAISIGSGGPYGAEGPIIMTGGAVGSLLAQMFHLTSSERKTLLAAGAAAGMSAIFASPIAAVLLAVELLLFEWRPRSLVPVAMASITAAALRPSLLGGAGPIFPLQAHASFTGIGLLACCAVGIIAGIFSTATSKLFYKIEDAFHHLPFHWMWWCVIGGLVVGIGGYFQPRALGVGYDVIEELLKGDVVLQAALALLLVKSLIWIISLASGTSGGVLAPLLMMGSGLGVVESLFLPAELKALYPLMSMAAVMGGMMRAPLAAVIFALEITHNIDSLVPTLAATIASYAVTVVFMKRSILTEKIARRGYDIYQEYGVDPLEPVSVAEAMLTSTNVSRSDVTFQKSMTIYSHQSCREAAELMAILGTDQLPVVSIEDPKTLIGVIKLSDLLKARLSHYEVEKKRERVLAVFR